MKTLSVNAIITSIRAKADRSISFTVNTPELSHEEKAFFFELQNLNLDMSISPREEENVPEYKIDKELGQKTQSSRIRAVLYILYTQNSENITTFEEYYKVKTEKFIEFLKEKIEDA